MPPVLWIRVIRGPDDFGIQDFRRLCDRPDGLPAHGGRIVQALDAAEDRRYAAGLVQVLHRVGAAGPHVAQVERLPADPVEVVQAELDAALRRDGGQVQHGVGRAADGHVDPDGVLERCPADDVQGLDVFLYQLHDAPAARVGDPFLLRVDGVGGRAARATIGPAPRSYRPWCSPCTGPGSSRSPGSTCPRCA